MSAVQGQKTSLHCKRPRPTEMPVAMHYPRLLEPSCYNQPGSHHQANSVQLGSSKWCQTPIQTPFQTSFPNPPSFLFQTPFKATSQPCRASSTSGISSLHTQHGVTFCQLLGLSLPVCQQQLYVIPQLVVRGLTEPCMFSNLFNQQAACPSSFVVPLRCESFVTDCRGSSKLGRC